MESNKRKKTKMTIEQAMVQLLKEKSFEYVSTVELAKTAGISRSSFYTHYKDKYDLIERYQQGLFQKLETIFEEYYNDRQQAILKVLDFLESEPLFSALLSENGTKEIQTFLRHKFQMMLHQELQERFNNKEFSQIEKEYNSVYLTNALFGVVQMWIAREKKESPQQMTDFLLKMLG
ncbi:TetR/AcrR family transcriptional regulator [Streptococcus gordonii]|uniref:TetR/AcrR family transcriptional regulator n=1 Tax=Streptococcus gordonii TaxID=1302 RepID=UPI0022E3F13B|nr:TetR/AcrR family transcriptional regulator [Streptococcus gordonii]